MLVFILLSDIGSNKIEQQCPRGRFVEGCNLVAIDLLLVLML